jgi:hypothetical protein
MGNRYPRRGDLIKLVGANFWAEELVDQYAIVVRLRELQVHAPQAADLICLSPVTGKLIVVPYIPSYVTWVQQFPKMD